MSAEGRKPTKNFYRTKAVQLEISAFFDIYKTDDIYVNYWFYGYDMNVVRARNSVGLSERDRGASNLWRLTAFHRRGVLSSAEW